MDEESLRALQETLAGLGEAVLIVDAATMTIVDCDPAAAEILGTERDELLGQPVEVVRRAQARGPDPAAGVLTASGLLGGASEALPAGPLLQPGSTPDMHDMQPATARAPARRRPAPAPVPLLPEGRSPLGEDSVRGSPAGGQPACFKAGPLALDRETNVALVAAGPGERRAALTPSEAGLLALLMERPGRVWSCRDLARLALGYDVVENEAVEIVRPHISRLRQKLEPDPLQPRLIRTVRGQGYLLSP